MANGRPRDEVRLDVEAGRPAIAPDVDALALRCAALLDRNRSDSFWNSIEARVRRSESCIDWMTEPTAYLEDLDPGTAEIIRQDVASKYERARAEARERGWDVVDDDAG